MEPKVLIDKFPAEILEYPNEGVFDITLELPDRRVLVGQLKEVKK